MRDCMKFERHIPVVAETNRAVSLLADTTELSHQVIKRVMQQGAVWLTQGKQTKRIRRADKRLKPGDQLHLYYDSKVLGTEVAGAELIADEDTYSVWYKPYGMLSQGSKWGDHCTLYRWAENHLNPQRPAFIVHRLDRAASGLMLLAHQKKIARQLSELFAGRQVDKRYQAVVHGSCREDVSVRERLDDKPAITHVHPLSFDRENNQTLVEVSIETGRKHQIRRHLAGLGLPIVGDRLYGTTVSPQQNLQLVACQLSFTGPDGERQKHYELPAHRQLKI